MRRAVLVTTVVVWAFISLTNPAAQAAVKPHGLISDGMVLQQGMPVPIWGTGDDGEKVTVRFQGQDVSTTARDGRWMVRLKPLQAGGPADMTIQGTDTVEIHNVLVGDVWICSGQSNMAWQVSQSANAEEAIAHSANPAIRLLTVPRKALDGPESELTEAKWVECNPETVPTFSAVGYFFGRELQKALKTPVGLINSSLGGTPAEAWTSRETLEANPALKSILDRHAQAAADHPRAVERHRKALAKWEAAAADAKRQGQDRPDKPRPPGDPKNHQRPCGLYNGMIRPLQPYAIAGVVWYQGESNAGRAYEYRTLFSAMIRNWREAWGQGDFPFLFVQLAPYMKIVHEPADSAWAELRDAQLFTTQAVPKTAMAVITDVGSEEDIHPKQKEPVGARLALAARAIACGEKIVYSGPVWEHNEIAGNKVKLHFRHVGDGLVSRDNPLTGFTIAGEDQKFFNARAEIDGDTVIVWAPEVVKPAAVRYGWANYPVGNLWNKNGLPASPFRTDRFLLTTQTSRAAPK